jgi:tetratricopeptide (TPR) repeat protein
MVEQGLMIKYQIMLFQAKDAARTGVAAKAVLDGPMKDNYRALAFIAQTMVSPQSKIDGLDMGVALKAAEQAVKLTNEKDAKVLEVLASVHFAKGDVAKAIEVQKKAVALDPKLQKTLDEYEAAAKK